MDDRHPYTKTDWLMWTAAMGNSQQVSDIISSDTDINSLAKFSTITAKVYKFANETPDRSPFTDW